MAYEQGDLVFQVPQRSLLAIDSWVHIFIADVVYGLFTRGAQFEQRLDEDILFKLGILATAMYEGKQVLDCSEVVKIGRNCTIDPSAVIHGPTTVGDNVTIGAGAVIENCLIGDNVNIGQGCQLMLSVVGTTIAARLGSAWRRQPKPVMQGAWLLSTPGNFRRLQSSRITSVAKATPIPAWAAWWQWAATVASLASPHQGLQACATLITEHDWVHARKDTEMGPPKWNAPQLAALLREFISRKNVPIFNLEIYQEGALSPKSVELSRQAATQLPPHH